MSSRALTVLASLSALVLATLVTYPILIGPADRYAVAQAWTTGVGFVPAVAAVAFMLASMAMQVWPEAARGQGWLVVSAGLLTVVITQETTALSAQTYVLQAAGAGVALAGLCRWAVTAVWLDAACAIAAFVVGVLLSMLIWGLTADWLREVMGVGILALVLLTTAVAVWAVRQPPEPRQAWDRRPTLVVAGVGVLVTAGVSFRESRLASYESGFVVGESDAIRVEAIGLLTAVLAVVILGIYAQHLGGERLVRAVVLGFGLAAPIYLVVSSPVLPRADLLVVIVLGVVAGAGLAHLTGKAAAIQACGLAVAAVGVHLMTLSTTDGLRGSLTGYHSAMAAMGFGCALALVAGLVPQARDQHSYTAAGLGLAAALFTAQGLGQLGIQAELTGGFADPVPMIAPLTAVAAVAMLVTMWVSGRAAQAARQRRRWPVESAGGSGGDQ